MLTVSLKEFSKYPCPESEHVRSQLVVKCIVGAAILMAKSTAQVYPTTTYLVMFKV